VSTTNPPRSPDDLARLGADLFARRVRPTLRPEDDGKFVAIDVVSGDFELDADDYAAVIRLRSRRPAGDIWLERAGLPTAYQLRRGQ
jgi:hypothetical protein